MTQEEYDRRIDTLAGDLWRTWLSGSVVLLIPTALAYGVAWFWIEDALAYCGILWCAAYLMFWLGTGYEYVRSIRALVKQKDAK